MRKQCVLILSNNTMHRYWLRLIHSSTLARPSCLTSNRVTKSKLKVMYAVCHRLPVVFDGSVTVPILASQALNALFQKPVSTLASRCCIASLRRSQTYAYMLFFVFEFSHKDPNGGMTNFYPLVPSSVKTCNRTRSCNELLTKLKLTVYYTK